jgi:hypothetical protein
MISTSCSKSYSHNRCPPTNETGGVSNAAFAALSMAVDNGSLLVLEPVFGLRKRKLEKFD